MQIKRYSMKDKNIYENFLTHINKNEPCIISNFIDNNNNDIKYIKNNNFKSRFIITKDAPICSLNNFGDFSKNNKDIKCTIYQCENNSNKHLNCYNELLFKLMNNERFIFYGENQPFGTRVWNDKKNKFTRDHFDGPGQAVLNISLKGKKKFQLARPNTSTYLPFSSVSIFNKNKKYDYEITLLPGNLLYIPPFWHHQVLTLEDNTQNINLIFYDYKQKLTNRNKAYLMIHKIFSTLTWNQSENDKTLNHINPYSLNTLKYFIKELGIYLLLINLILYFTNINYKILMIILLIYIDQNKKLSYETKGVSNLYIRIIILITILNIITLSKN